LNPKGSASRSGDPGKDGDGSLVLRCHRWEVAYSGNTRTLSLLLLVVYGFVAPIFMFFIEIETPRGLAQGLLTIFFAIVGGLLLKRISDCSLVH